MPTYIVTIERVAYEDVVIEAESAEDAQFIVEDLYSGDGDVVSVEEVEE